MKGRLKYTRSGILKSTYLKVNIIRVFSVKSWYAKSTRAKIISDILKLFLESAQTKCLHALKICFIYMLLFIFFRRRRKMSRVRPGITRASERACRINKIAAHHAISRTITDIPSISRYSLALFFFINSLERRRQARGKLILVDEGS